MERIYSYERLPKLKKAALLLTAGGGGFTAAKQTYQDAIIRHMGAKGLGVVTSIGNQSKNATKADKIRKLVHKI